LIKNPDNRLGTNGAEEIKAHPWFKNVNWNDLSQKKVLNEIFQLKLNFFLRWFLHLSPRFPTVMMLVTLMKNSPVKVFNWDEFLVIFLNRSLQFSVTRHKYALGQQIPRRIH